LAVLRSSRLLHIHDATSSTQADICDWSCTASDGDGAQMIVL